MIFTCREDGSPSWGRKHLIWKYQFHYIRREDGSPSWGRKLTNLSSDVADNHGREDGSPSWGRKPIYFDLFSQITHRQRRWVSFVGTETAVFLVNHIAIQSREDGSPSWGRKPVAVFSPTNRYQQRRWVPFVGTETIVLLFPVDLFKAQRRWVPFVGTETSVFVCVLIHNCVEKMDPLRGDGNTTSESQLQGIVVQRRWVPFVGTETPPCSPANFNLSEYKRWTP